MAFDKRRTKWLLSTLVASATYSIFISYYYSWVGNLPNYIAILLSLSVVPIASLMLLWEAADFLVERSRIYVSVLLAIVVLALLFVSTLDRPENYFWLIIAWLAAVVLM
jgi:Na+/melibiose symporter-like transporter